MRKFAIGVNDVIFKALFIILAIINFFIAPNISMFIGYMCITSIGWAIVSGFWFAVSGIYHELVKMNARAERQEKVAAERESFL